MEEENEVELEDIDINEITYEGLTLLEWQEELTVKIPSLPCEPRVMQQSIIDIGNKYQKAYNAFSTLYVVSSQAESTFKAEKYKLVGDYLADCKKKNLKAPSKESVEAIVINSDKNKRVRQLMERFQIYEVIREFFSQHKTKLEKVLTVIKEILYSVNSSTRVEHKGNI